MTWEASMRQREIANGLDPGYYDPPGPPEVMGASEAARELGVTVQNLNRLAGFDRLPYQRLRATRVWLAEDVRKFARSRRPPQ
jgi:hypothetical protein